jgi:hypothetical protein
VTGRNASEIDDIDCLTNAFSHALVEEKLGNGVKWFVMSDKIVVTGKRQQLSREDAKTQRTAFCFLKGFGKTKLLLQPVPREVPLSSDRSGGAFQPVRNLLKGHALEDL